MIHNKKLLWVLGILLAGIWGTVIYLIVSAVGEGGSGESVTVEGPAGGSSPVTERFVYRKDVRDPFAFRQEVQKKASGKKDSTTAKAWSEPPFKLIGIVRKDQMATAVLQRADGETFFVRKGDTLGGMKVLGIEAPLVRYAFRGQDRTWSLESVGK